MLTLKLIGSVLGNVFIFGVMLFVPAATLDWWRAWVFLGVVAVACTLTMFVVFGDNEASLDERYKMPVQKDQPLADKIIVPLLVVSFFVLVIFIPLDVFRYHVMAPPPDAISALGLAMFIFGWTVMALSLRENAFAAPVVKLQEERNMRVIDSGVYAVVRHPMYAGAVPLMFGIALWLQSTAAAIFALVPVLVLAVRIVNEEKFLRKALAGYDTYTQRVPYRLIPYLW